MVRAGCCAATDRLEFTVDETSPQTWNDLHPALPRPMTQAEAIHHHNTRQAIAAMPRNIFGIAILRALNMRLPNPPRNPQMVTRAMVEESNRRIQQMKAEQAAEQAPALTDTTNDAVEELRGSVVRSEAQSTFEAQMRASALRGTLKA